MCKRIRNVVKVVVALIGIILLFPVMPVKLYRLFGVRVVHTEIPNTQRNRFIMPRVLDKYGYTSDCIFEYNDTITYGDYIELWFLRGEDASSFSLKAGNDDLLKNVARLGGNTDVYITK